VNRQFIVVVVVPPMNTLDIVERKALFRFTRLLALTLILVLSIGLVAALATLIATWKPGGLSRVDPDDVLLSLREAGGATAPANGAKPPGAQEPNILPGVTVPFVLQEYFSDPTNRNVLLAHIDRYTTDEQQDYMDNLADVVQESQKKKANVVDAINAFFRLKDKKLQDAQVRRAADQAKQLYELGFTVSALGLIGVFSLVLVLLAIERNTRPSRPIQNPASREE
jgi:hypothetical protein